MLQGSVASPVNRVGTSCSLHTQAYDLSVFPELGQVLQGSCTQHLESISGSDPPRPPHLYLDERFIIRAS